METLKIDRTRLQTVSTYAAKNSVTRQTVYNWIKSKELKAIEIDGVTFIQV